ncbi:hypothetical protein [Amycolatopsis sp. NPDC021455]|uniref:hypothetical protein n=1 Tax=Amycolatopsis sp. NPDC021455 TaxID=3154901 RepID=UPI0033DEA2DA
MAEQVSPESDSDDDTALVVAALNHSWAWYDARIGRGLQVVNYFLVAIAVLATAYVNAMNSKLYAVAAVIGLASAALTAASFSAGIQQRRLASKSELALSDLQDLIATRLEVDSFRMVQNPPVRTPRYVPSLIAFGVSGVLCLGSVLYALLGH